MKRHIVPIQIKYENGNLKTYLYGKIKKSEEMSIEEVLLYLGEWIEFEDYSFSSYADGTLRIEVG